MKPVMKPVPAVFLMIFCGISFAFAGIFGSSADKALVKELSTDVDSLSSQLSAKERELEMAEAAKMKAARAKDRLLREIGGYKTTIESLQVSLAASGRESQQLSAYAKLHEKRQKVSVVERLGLSPVHRGSPESYFTDPRVKARIRETIKAMPLIPELEKAFIAQIDTAAPTTGRLDNGLYEFMGFSKFRYLDYTYIALDSLSNDYAWTFPPVDLWGRKAQLTIPWACFNPTIRWLLTDTVIQRDTVKVDSIIEIEVESPPDTVVRDSIIIDTICPPSEPPQDKKQGCKWGELFMWLGHYSPVPHLDEGRGEFLGSMGEVFFGCSRTNFGLGYYANGWDWKTYSGRSSGFDIAAGPALNFAWRRARLMLFAYYDIEGSWFESDHQEDVYMSQQWSHSVYPGLTFNVWSADGDRWFESWLNAQIMVEGYKLSYINGQVQSRENDPADDKTCLFSGCRLFPFSGFRVGKSKAHFGFSAKISHALEDGRVELILGPVIDIGHVLKLSLDWKGTFNSRWEQENGNSVGVVLDLDVVNAVSRNR